jgi:uncharacterized membrane protein YqjE
MDEDDKPSRGWLQRLQLIGDSLLALAHNRIGLFAVELQEEKLRALNLAVWIVVALTLCSAGLFVGLGALALFLWNVAGYWGLIGLTVAILSASATLLWWIRRRMRCGPPPFAETLAEFRKDRECLRNQR